MENRARECESCGKRFEKISLSGMAGYCPLHGWCPLYDDRASIAEVAKLNFQERLRKRWGKISQMVINRFTALIRGIISLRKFILIFVALGSFAGGIAKYVVLPMRNYNAAEALLMEGVYQAARAAFEELGSYKDSKGNVLLCDAIISLQENDLETAVQALRELEEREDEKNAAALQNSLQTVISDWKNRGISAETLLSLLQESDLIDPEGSLELEKLSAQAHAELAFTENTKAWCTAELGEDQETTLLLLNNDYTITAYRMLEMGNQEKTLDKKTQADCLLIFEEKLLKSDPELAAGCGQAALEKAETAFQEARTTDVFRFYYEIMEKYCEIQQDNGQAAEIWEQFRQENSAFLVSCDMDEAAAEKAGELMLVYAKDLMAREDISCSTWLRKAWECGADVEETLLAAVECFTPGRTRTELRLMVMEFYGEASAEASGQKELLEKELEVLLEEWQDAATPPEDALYFLTLAETQGFALEVDVQQIYQKAMLAATAGEQWKKYLFMDFDLNGREELLGLSGNNMLKLYAMQGEKPVCISTLQTQIVPSDLWINEAGTVVAESGEQDAFAVCICSGPDLQCVYEIDGILNYQRTDAALTYELALPGSIERRRQYRYDLLQPQNEPVTESIDWQQENYPVPKTAEEAAVRYLEAISYHLPEELKVLTAEKADMGDTFSLDLPELLQMTDDFTQIRAEAYDVTDDRVLMEVSCVGEGDTEVRFYAEALYNDGWKISGFAGSFASESSIDGGDSSIPLLPLNEKVSAALQDKDDRDVYRMLLTASSRIQMVWQAGEKEGNTEAFQVNLYKGDITSEPVITYCMKLSSAKQMSMPLFVSAGLYYVTVEALSYSDCQYQLTMQAVEDLYAETEDNDTADNANSIELNQSYSGSLSDKNDIDYFRFTTEQPGEIHIRLGTLGEGSRQSCYRVQLMNGISGKVLSAGEMAGNTTEMDTGAVYAAPGEYVIRIEKGDSWLGMEYHVTAEFTQMDEIEQEGNDTPETATVIPVNETVKGVIGTEGDVDCFRFTLDNDAVVQVKLNIEPLETSGKAHVVSVLRGTEALLTANIGGKEASRGLQPLVLGAGTYTLRLENIKFARQEYSINVACEEITLAEAEPNDTQVQATELKIGTEMTGVLSSAEDVDWYKLSLPQQQVLTFTMTFPQGSGKSKIFILQLEQNGKVLWPLKLEEGSGGTVQILQISAGEYYFCVKPGEWNGCIYTISFK